MEVPMNARIPRSALVLLSFTISVVARASAWQTPVWRLSDRPVLAVGEVFGTREEQFTNITGAIRLADGRYVVADGSELRLSVYGGDGRLQTTIGREGGGPGEFRSIHGTWRAGRDTILTWDSALQRITRFLPDGSVVRTDALSARPAGTTGIPDVLAGVTADGRLVIVWMRSPRAVQGRLLPDTMTFGLFESTGRFVRLIGEEMAMQRTYTPGVGGGPFAFSAWPWMSVVGDTLIFTNGLDGTVQFYGTRSSTAHAARSLQVDGSSPSLDDAWHELDDALSAAKAMPLTRRLAEATDRSLGTVPRFAAMLADDRGRVWLKQYEPSRDAIPVRMWPPGSGGTWRIVEADGRVVARIRLPDNLSPIAIRGDTLLGVERDDLDVQQFVVYRILR
jgi:YD repeat-containing protein